MGYTTVLPFSETGVKFDPVFNPLAANPGSVVTLVQ